MNARWTILAVLLLCASSEAADETKSMGKLLGRSVYWVGDNVRLDTLCWDEVEEAILGIDSTDRIRPSEAVGVFADSGYQLYRITNASAVGVALLHDAGCRVLVLSQWNATPQTYFSLNGPSSRGDAYEKQRGVTDYLWERVERTEVAKPGRLGEGFGVTCHFADGGYCTWQSADELCKHVVQMVTPADGVHLQFTSGTEMQLTFARRVYEAYAVASSDSSLKQIMSAVDAAMDKMKLDLSYRAPTLVPLKKPN
jgi:hypothetical protein